MKRALFLPVFTLLGLLLPQPSPAQTPSYVYIDLGVLSESAGNVAATSYATGINDDGTIVGVASNSSGNPTAFVYDSGVMTNLGDILSGGAYQYSYAYAINQAGSIAGSFYQSTTGAAQAFLYANGKLSNLGALSPNVGSVAYGLNESNQVVGSSSDSTGVEHAFIYTGGKMLDLGFLETGASAFSTASGVNDAGVAVGDSEIFTSIFGYDIPHAFHTTSYAKNTGLFDMGPEIDDNYYYKSIAYAIDDAGVIVGGACPVCPGSAFVYKDGAFTFLGTLSGDDSSYATAKNDFDQIVGASYLWSGSSGYSNNSYIPGATKFGTRRRGFVYQKGTMYDLNAVSKVPSGWTIVEAAGINSSGMIVGYAIQGSIEQIGSVSHAVLLVPSTSFATIKLGSLTATYNGKGHAATAVTDPAGLKVTFTYDGSTTAPVDAGRYAVIGAIGTPGYEGSATGTLVIGKAAAKVTLHGLAASFNGSAHAATATTSPAGLKVTFTYDKHATVPTKVGTYTVAGTIGDANYEGGATGKLVIGKGAAKMTLHGLSATFDGKPHPVTATTNPAGLKVTFTYDGSATAPTAVGHYRVVATVSSTEYEGTADGTLIIAKAK